ncbi:MAG: hypothetical protein ABIJ00_09860 [Candidatus Eisenbacteria bacterium]
MKHKHLIVPLSVVCITISMLLGRFAGEGIRWIIFAEGLFLGLAMSLSVFALIIHAVLRGYE